MKHSCIKIGNIFCVFSGMTWIFYTIGLHAITKTIVLAQFVLLEGRTPSPDEKKIILVGVEV